MTAREVASDSVASDSGKELLAGFEPVISADCKLIVLGSFPGVASLVAGQYYAHPRNQFWSIAGEVLGKPFMQWDFDTRYEQLNAAGVGLWDVIAQCERPGSLDSNIRHARPAQLDRILSLAPRVTGLLLNGKKAQQGARLMDWGRIELFDLPSTSPANAGTSRDEKLRLWRDALERGLA